MKLLKLLFNLMLCAFSLRLKSNHIHFNQHTSHNLQKRFLFYLRGIDKIFTDHIWDAIDFNLFYFIGLMTTSYNHFLHFFCTGV